MSSHFQEDNNCYNYACNIATNSFAHPGRRNLHTFRDKNGRITGPSVIAAAQADGLIFVGDADMPLSEAAGKVRSRYARKEGHLVALLIAPARPGMQYRGDFHWLRCDSPAFDRWSHKNGSDQVVNFDFHGKRIKDPSVPVFIINLGAFKLRDETRNRFVRYVFNAWMFVPFGKVDII